MEAKRVHDKHSILTAIDRLGAGFGARANRYGYAGEMTMARAQQILRGSVDELLALREVNEEFVCVPCARVFLRIEFEGEVCPTCETQVQPRHLLHILALEDSNKSLREQVRELQDTLKIVLEYEPAHDEVPF